MQLYFSTGRQLNRPAGPNYTKLHGILRSQGNTYVQG